MSVTPAIRRVRGKARASLDLIAAAVAILVEIHPASVRAVCYRLFTMGLIADMSKNETNKVSTRITWAREQGLIPWGWIVDETRSAERGVSAFKDPAEYIEVVRRSYRKDRWTNQPVWLEVWSEKGTIRGMLAPVLHAYGVTFRVMHGYGSATAVQQVASETIVADRHLDVLYIGDWDPSGLHMSEEDLPRRLDRYGGDVTVTRLALTETDLSGDLPSFSVDTKRGDPRYRWFRRRFPGGRCWELDALSPVVLRDRVEQAILDRLDMDAWQQAEITEAAEFESMSTILDAWPGISRQARKYSDGPAEGEVPR